jgi:hypothetical protein
VRDSIFTPTVEGEARLLLLIDTFTRRAQGLEGRTKLAKLDFLLRYPKYFERALRVRVGETVANQFSSPGENIETRMVRYRYGPWDPAYFALLGALKGRGLIVEIPARRGVSYKVTEEGSRTAARLAAHEAWSETAAKAAILKNHFDLQGTTLKKFIYQHFPEVTSASWGDPL